ncbi:hypothetical protein COLO4_32461 [Corchorus olitorius]|uniref:Uncharacterized protein n=1 Tax=Corchorus olitorius TaxID=93759 RepID=A0A1R3GZI7_9ROSI|nr:hypothetical protein COLO4_32461 [Corchorus olitorius]
MAIPVGDDELLLGRLGNSKKKMGSLLRWPYGLFGSQHELRSTIHEMPDVMTNTLFRRALFQAA